MCCADELEGRSPTWSIGGNIFNGALGHVALQSFRATAIALSDGANQLQHAF